MAAGNSRYHKDLRKGVLFCFWVKKVVGLKRVPRGFCLWLPNEPFFCRRRTYHHHQW